MIKQNEHAFLPDEKRKFPKLTLSDLTRELYCASRRNASAINSPIDLVGDVAPSFFAMPCSKEENSALISLPPALQSSFSLRETIQRRASTRFYAPTAIPLNFLATLLYNANYKDTQERGLPLQFSIVAWRVEGIVPAVYRYIPESHALQRTGDAPIQSNEAENLVLQREFAFAPIIILIIGDLAATCTRSGAWGHRQLLLSAGMAGQRFWFASLGLGLVGTVFAGFLPQGARAYLGTDGYTRLNLLAYATGYPFVRVVPDSVQLKVVPE